MLDAGLIVVPFCSLKIDLIVDCVSSPHVSKGSFIGETQRGGRKGRGDEDRFRAFRYHPWFILFFTHERHETCEILRALRVLRGLSFLTHEKHAKCFVPVVYFVVNSSVEDGPAQSVPPAPLLPEEGWPSGRGGGRAGGLRSSSGETGVRFEH